MAFARLTVALFLCTLVSGQDRTAPKKTVGIETGPNSTVTITDSKIIGYDVPVKAGKNSKVTVKHTDHFRDSTKGISKDGKSDISNTTLGREAEKGDAPCLLAMKLVDKKSADSACDSNPRNQAKPSPESVMMPNAVERRPTSNIRAVAGAAHRQNAELVKCKGRGGLLPNTSLLPNTVNLCIKAGGQRSGNEPMDYIRCAPRYACFMAAEHVWILDEAEVELAKLPDSLSKEDK